MASIEEQMKILDREMKVNCEKIHKSTYSYDGETHRYQNTPIPKYAKEEAVIGSFTGATMVCSMIPRQGRGLLYPGRRIFDDLVVDEWQRNKLVTKQTIDTHG